jgi:protein-S-isoprenylcysteine O-methyltransferase Ste14
LKQVLDMPVPYIQFILFILISILIGYLSRDSLRLRHSHSLTRFLALESILALTILSIPVWLVDPLSYLQILSWTLLLSALILAVYGYRLLILVGKPEMKLEGNNQLAVEGFYKYIRHPLYTSLILFSMGLFLKAATLANTVLLLSGMLFLYLSARDEEMENLDRFGVEYAEYLDTSKMFVPFVF